MKRILTALIFAGALLCSCSEDEIPVFGGVYGVISDMSSEEPVSGATVILAPGNVTTVTGYDGHYEFKNLESKQYLLSVSADGYASNSRQVSVVPGNDVICSIVLGKMTGAKISNSYLNFGEADIEKQIVLTRIGNEPVSWTVADCPSWVKVFPEDGTISIKEQSRTLTVVIDRKGMGSAVNGGFLLVVNGINNYISVEAVKDGDSEGGDQEPSVDNVFNGLYGYYTFEENTENLVDGAGSAVPVNNPEYVDGLSGKGIKFSISGNSYLNFPEPMVKYGSSSSVSFWCKGMSDGHIFHVNNSKNGYNQDFILNMKAGKLGVVNGYTWIYQPSDETNYFSHPTFDPGKWYMITMTFTWDYLQVFSMSLYVNGDLNDTKEFSATSETSAKTFTFGGNMTYSNDSMTAAPITIDNLRFYNSRALKANEVKQIYNYEK